MSIYIYSAKESALGFGLFGYMRSVGRRVYLVTNKTEMGSQENDVPLIVNAYLKYSSLYQLPLNEANGIGSSWIHQEHSWCHEAVRRFLHASGVTSSSLRILTSIPQARQTLSFTYRLLENSITSGTNAKHIMFSSRAVYGVPLYYPVDEFHPLNPRTIYGLLKATQENIYRYFASEKGVPICILRISDAYGPMRKASNYYLGTIPGFIWAAHQIGKIEVNGDGRFRRDFLYSEDLFRIVETIAAQDQWQNFIINIGSFNGVEILEVANLIRTRFKTADIVLCPMKSENSFTFDYSSRFLSSEYSGFNFTSIQDGLEKVYVNSILD